MIECLLYNTKTLYCKYIMYYVIDITAIVWFLYHFGRNDNKDWYFPFIIHHMLNKYWQFIHGLSTSTTTENLSVLYLER